MPIFSFPSCYVDVSEVEDVAFGRHATYRVRHDRFALVGQTEAGRYLTVIVAPRTSGVYSLVTAGDAEDSERRLYRRVYRRR
jgi:uncharacterized DUF497 family protein